MKFYPVLWRLAYGFSIVSAIIIVCLFAAAFFDSRLWPPFIVAFACKGILESRSAKFMMKRLHVKLSVSDLIIAQILLPIYTVLRPLLLLLPRFSWRGLQHVTRSYHPKAAS
jgi:hypothetical protein